MSYSILRLIELLENEFPLLLNSIMKRIPILVTGIDIELVDDLVDSVASLCPHRHQLVFWRDFTSEDEILSVWEEEKHNYEVNRTVVCSFASNLKLGLERIKQFSGWIIGVPIGTSSVGIYISQSQLDEVITHISQSSKACGVLSLLTPSTMRFELVNASEGDLEVEKRIVNKILTRKTQSLERIRRLLSKSLRGAKVSDGIINAVLKLDDESEKITDDMFVEEISNFVHAARRAVTLLSRIRLARELGTSTVLTERNLYEAIGWDGGDLADLIQFIRAEWHEDFSDCVKIGALSGLGAFVDSMWGT